MSRVYDPIEHVMSFGDHLDELRRRVIFALIGPVLIGIVCLVFGGPLLEFLTAPLVDALRAANQPPSLLATSPIEPFAAYLKVAFVIALLISMPWVLYQLWLFVAPGLYAQERRFAYFLLPMSAVMTLAGMSFLYYILMPIMLYFLVVFGTGLIEQNVASGVPAPGINVPQIPVLTFDPDGAAPGAMWFNDKLGQLRIQVDSTQVMGVSLQGGGVIAQQYRIGEYVSLIFWLGIVFALAFQLPLVMMLASWLGIIEVKDLTRYRRQILFGCAIAGAIFTPQDPMSMLLLGGALYALFEFGLVLIRFVPASRVARGFGTDGQSGDEDPDL